MNEPAVLTYAYYPPNDGVPLVGMSAKQVLNRALKGHQKEPVETRLKWVNRIVQ